MGGHGTAAAARKGGPLDVNQSIWIRSALTDSQYIFRSLRDTLLRRGITVLTLNGPKDAEGLEKIRQKVWASDAHVILDGMMPGELNKLRPIFERRKNFSMGLVDWWTSVYWFTKNADYLLFRNYNGIAARRGLGQFMGGRKPPLWLPPDKKTTYGLACSALRVPALAAAPLLELQKAWQRSQESFPVERLIYFPFSIAAEHVPLVERPIKYDFANVSGTGGFWTVRDPHASAWLNYANLYYDRWRITDRISELNQYRVFDLRKNAYMKWDAYCETTRSSRFAIATGGIHQNSVAKYAEFICLGVPMVGEDIPYEYPWLKDCLYPVDTLNATAKELEPQLREALAQQPRLRENCLALRSRLFDLYSADRILDLVQEQVAGKPLPEGYLKPGVAGPLGR